ncbi:LOW QUALITY PROTEIN: protein BREAST CANCER SUSCEPTIBILITY 2 homolog B-like [Primulina tabacum]|uniref:LOW QUALITY PROTEIN: protein BREAST CANCER SUSCEPTIBILITY 2 homolog B-like n=1 Tax=Primulina tabacum TaxID=48773 RepID=UPI003F59643C
MSTWQVFADAESHFRWEQSDQQLWREGQSDAPALRTVDDTSRLPSMQDLLIQGRSKILENEKGNLDNSPMFRTGMGKSVAVKQSSIAKARSVLGDVGDVFADAGQNERANGLGLLKPMLEMNSLKPLKSGLLNRFEDIGSMSNSMFQTGSGKTVSISSAGLLRAKTLLGMEENYGDDPLHDFQQTKKQLTCTELIGGQRIPHLKTDDFTNLNCNSYTKVLTPFGTNGNSIQSESKEFPDFMNTANKPSPVKFHTAGGRSISVSNDALQRARSLLGNLEFDSFLNDANSVDSVLSTLDNRKASCTKKKIDLITPVSKNTTENFNCSSRNFTSPLRSSSYHQQLMGRFKLQQPGNNLINKFDAEAASTSSTSYNGLVCYQNSFESERLSENVDSSKNENDSLNHLKRPSNVALIDITNSTSINHIDSKRYFGKKRRNGRINSVSPFKKPRSSFVTPLNTKNSSVPNDLSRLVPKERCCKEKISVRYPRQIPRAYVKDYISLLPPIQRKLENLPAHVMKMNPKAAESYTFQSEQASVDIGPEALHLMLSKSGASSPCLTKEWVSNHYKWIVWKLASYERRYPDKFLGKFLTVSNVLEELKYRYEREVVHGHRSAIRKVLDGDVVPSSMMVLCISSVCEYGDPKSGPQSVALEGHVNGGDGKIELTDGWYSVKALLDEPLSKQLASRKLFLGQKLRIWGAKLCGWIGPISPLEGSHTSVLSLHLNGTYRCHWAERLGFCKSAGAPLAFRSIKSTGGAIPSTLIGITRIYPILYRERLNSGNVTVRSQRMETEVMHLYNQRRSAVVEGIISAFKWETNVDIEYNHDGEEGANIMKLLETSAEPEILMAGMSSKQLSSFASYKAKLKAIKQIDMEKSIEKALEAAGLSERDVTPFLRVKVVGLTDKCHQQKYCPREGLITIWYPTEKQKQELCEGKAYSVGGVAPTSSDSGTLCLQTRGSTSTWTPLSPVKMENFEPFFVPRSSITISNLGEVSLSSEFDIAAFVVYVGEVYVQGHRKKQWVFVTDGSTPESCPKESLDAVLAVSFSLPYVECESFAPVNKNVAGSVVGFCNLIKIPKDQANGLWVAEAAENSDYFLTYDDRGRNHLKYVAASVLKWAKTSSVIEKLKENVHAIIKHSKEGC